MFVALVLRSSFSENFSTFGSFTRTLTPGVYQMTVWGAAGGTDGRGYSAGGYASGLISIYRNTAFIITVGGKGVDGSSAKVHAGGYNGGGLGLFAPGGGGATDIRAYEDTIYHRIIVAGGGGGSNDNLAWGGGKEGGVEKYDGRGNPGTQMHAGIGCYISSTTTCTDGSFGIGGDAKERPGNNNVGAGGGGGWFGGASGGDPSSTTWGEGGGGSGFVLTSASFSNAPDYYLLKYNEDVYLYEDTMIGGNLVVPSRTGSGTQKNANGHGYARITKIKDIYTPTPVLCAIPKQTKALKTCEATLKCTFNKKNAAESGPNIIYSALFATLE